MILTVEVVIENRKQKTLALRLEKPFMISLPDVIERPVQTI